MGDTDVRISLPKVKKVRIVRLSMMVVAVDWICQGRMPADYTHTHTSFHISSSSAFFIPIWPHIYFLQNEMLHPVFKTGSYIVSSPQFFTNIRDSTEDMTV